MTLTDTQKSTAKIVGAVAIAIVAAVLYYQFFILPGKQRERVTTAENGVVVSDARNQATQEAQVRTEKHYVERRIIEERANAGVASVLAAPDDDSASDAARAAVCMFNHSYPADHPTCKVQ
jgi:hypothetical protein